MKYFVFSDVHGHFDALVSGLEKAGFDVSNPDHMLISCGDNFDRGTQNYSMLIFLNEMIRRNKLIAIWGNHDFFLEELNSGMRVVDKYDKANGVLNTCYNFINKVDGAPKSIDIKNIGRILTHRLGSEYDFLSRHMRKSFETKNYIFTHGYVTTEGTTDWRDATWSCGYQEVKIFPQSKTVVFGHYFAYLAKEFEQGTTKETDYNNLIDLAENYWGDGYICIDSCTSYTNIVNVLVIEDEEEDER